MTDDEYRAAMAELDHLLAGNELALTPEEAERAIILAAAIEAYEKERFPIAEPTPEEAAAFRAEQESKKS